jgi:hypothetical protein
MKYKLWDVQRNEYKHYDYNEIIYDDLKEVEESLWNFHSVDYGGLEEKEFNELTFNGMLMLFDWEVHNAKTNKLKIINK